MSWGSRPVAKPSTEQNKVATTFRVRSRPVAGEDAGLEPLRRADQRVGGALAKAAGRGRCFRVCVDGGAGERRGGEVADLPLGGQVGQVIEHGDASVVRAGRLLRLLGRTSNGSSVVRSGRPRYRTRTPPTGSPRRPRRGVALRSARHRRGTRPRG